MEVSVAVEHRRPINETPMQRLGREIAGFGAAIFRMSVLALILTPVLLGSFLTADLPVRNFDHLADMALMKPSHWLNVGGLIMNAGAPLAILFTRRFGGDEASRAVTAAWGLAAVASFAEISYLAPILDTSDFPNVRFVVAFVSSALVGQYMAIGVFDVIRGGGPWWRPPFVAALSGYGAQSLLYFPIGYWTTDLPWFNWMISDFTVKAAAALAFLPIYGLLQKPLRPVGGYGGR
ncbi:MAG TPA: VUT family protein [Parvularculaceae bacterium]|nr:VUT family protein [Parvularculaceae bacterium]